MYKRINPELHRIIQIFNKNGLNYNLFKCEHIFEGENKNLDIIFRTIEDYNKASKILNKENYLLYMSEKVERYKKMYLLFKKEVVYAIHLHREVSWHGIIVLNKEKVFERARNNIPSPEDSLLIHSAHALFENFKISSFQRKLLAKYKKETKDKNYINSQLVKFGWKKEFYKFIKDFSITKRLIVQIYFSCLIKHPLSILTLGNKLFKYIRRKISLERKCYLIALIGVNGSGKTTLTHKLLEKYENLTRFMGIKQERYYFGWVPFSFIAKIISKMFRRKAIFKETAVKSTVIKNNQKINKNKMFQELLFLYNFCEYLYRYIFTIYPKLRTRKLLISDRYFYDIYGQYPSAKKSIIVPLLFKLFPSPDLLIILDANTKTIMKRNKAGQNLKRNVFPKEYLDCQKERYKEISTMFNAPIIDTENKLENNIDEITSHSWNSIIKRVRL
ncbi:hypothetical protein HON71_00655 [Candidatus Woesearchaeota archaeon]|jgi:thymidylate kinase|nr:hypothetical protein [Candidatus Woesearchaeota archaeon]